MKVFFWFVALVSVVALVPPLRSSGATFETENFKVEAPDQAYAVEVAERAEELAGEIGRAWFGVEPVWKAAFQITVKEAAKLGGKTDAYLNERRDISKIEMTLQGPRELLLRSGLPHEMTRAVFMRQLGKPLPLWVREGVLYTAQDPQEKAAIREELKELLVNGRGQRLAPMMVSREPPKGEELRALELQAFLLCDFLLQLRGKSAFLDFIDDGMHYSGDEPWRRALRRHYPFGSEWELQVRCEQWILDGCPLLKPLEPVPSEVPPAPSPGSVPIPADPSVLRGNSET